jgi:DUF4097 and DUF4098 domain-containing protein YvlB
MSKAKIITIVCWLLTAAILIALVIWFLTGNLFRSVFNFDGPFSGGFSITTLTGPYNEVGTYSVNTEGIDTLDVDWTAGAVTITPYDGSEIKITEFAQRELEDREKLVYNVNGDTLEIDYIAPGLSFNMMTKKLEVLVPASLAEKLEKLAVDATSADLTVRDFNMTELDIDETSGTTNLSGITSETAEVSAVSGTIDISDTDFTSLTAGTVSGEIKLSNVTADTLNTNSTSGSHILDGTFKDIDASSVSGEIKITGTVNPDSITCGTTSGSIFVTIPGGSDLNVHYSTVSGHFTSEIPVKNAGGAPYNFNTVSGSITLKAA